MAQDGFVFKGNWSNSLAPSEDSPILERDVYCYDSNDDRQPYFLPSVKRGSLLVCLQKITTVEDKMDLKNWEIKSPPQIDEVSYFTINNK